MLKRDLEFLYEIGTLRNIQRAWKQIMATDVASDPEHSFRVAFIALIIARGEGVKNEEKILKMALVHDLAETRVGDGHYVNKVYVEYDEERATEDTFRDTSLSDLRDKYLCEYEERKSIEAKIVKDADNLDIDFELKEMEERGHKLPVKFLKFRKMVRDKKLYTRTAKKIWDLNQKFDPASWHLKTNKWLKIPKAGL